MVTGFAVPHRPPLLGESVSPGAGCRALDAVQGMLVPGCRHGLFCVISWVPQQPGRGLGCCTVLGVFYFTDPFTSAMLMARVKLGAGRRMGRPSARLACLCPHSVPS